MKLSQRGQMGKGFIFRHNADSGRRAGGYHTWCRTLVQLLQVQTGAFFHFALDPVSGIAQSINLLSVHFIFFTLFEMPCVGMSFHLRTEKVKTRTSIQGGRTDQPIIMSYQYFLMKGFVFFT